MLLQSAGSVESFHILHCSGLTEPQVNDAIDKILRSRNTTVLFVAHRLSTIARAERIVVLEGGRIVESGSYHELVSTLNYQPSR